METFNVTFHYLGRNWFLNGKYWTDELARASHHTNVEAASAALATARRYMRNKQVKSRIVAATTAVEAPPIGGEGGQKAMFPSIAGAA